MSERTWQLRAMNVADLLDETIRLYRHNFLTFIGIVALLQVPMTILTTVLTTLFSQKYIAVLQDNLEGPDMMPSDTFFLEYFVFIGVILLLTAVNYLVINNLVTAALAMAISNRYLGEPVSIGSAYRSVLGRFWSLMGALILLVLINMGLFIVPIILTVIQSCLGLIALLIALIAWALINIRLTFITQAVVLEEETASASLGRSWRLIDGYGWRTLGVYLLLWLFAMLLVSIPSYVISFGMQALTLPLAIQTLVSGVLSAALGTLYMPIRLTGLTLLYYDLRIRKEGLDLELQAAALGEGVGEPVPASVVSSIPVEEVVEEVARMVESQDQEAAEKASQYHDKGDLHRAIRAYWAAIAQRPDDASLHNDLGLALHELGNLEAALREFRRAAELEPDHPTAYYNMALAYRDQDDLPAAREALETYLRLEPDPQVRATVQSDSGLAVLRNHE